MGTAWALRKFVMMKTIVGINRMSSAAQITFSARKPGAGSYLPTIGSVKVSSTVWITRMNVTRRTLYL